MSQPRILLIEDDESFRLLVEHMLSKRYEVHPVTDGIEALGRLSAGEIPDLILADIDAPRINGAELLAMLATSGIFRSIPVVIVSGRSDETIARALLERGARGVLLKPFNPQELFAMLEAVLA